MQRVSVVLLLCLLLLVSAAPRRSAAQDPGADAAAAAVEISRLEAEGAYDALYDRMHPDAQAISPRETVVGWYEAESAPLGPGVITVLSVAFVDWTWEVTGTTYPNTAEVSFSQPYADGTVSQGVLRLVESGGEWRWFFGRDRAFVDAQNARFGGVPAPSGTQPEPVQPASTEIPIPPAPTEEPVVGSTYTSPQFGYRISWKAPWEPGTASSEPNERDDFRLDAADVYLIYRGIFTDAAEGDVLRAYGEERRRNTPGATIDAKDADASESPSLLLRYTDATGGAKVETITTRSLVPGEAMLLRTLGALEDQRDPNEVVNLLDLVTEELPGSAGSQAGSLSSTTEPDTADCADVERWWSETAQRRQEAEEAIAEIGRVGSGSVPTYTTAVNGYGRFRALAEEQRTSDPPGAAAGLNDALVSVFDELTSAMWSFALAGGDEYGPTVKPSLVSRGMATYVRAISAYSQPEPYDTLASRCAALTGRLPADATPSTP